MSEEMGRIRSNGGHKMYDVVCAMYGSHKMFDVRVSAAVTSSFISGSEH